MDPNQARYQASPYPDSLYIIAGIGAYVKIKNGFLRKVPACAGTFSEDFLLQVSEKVGIKEGGQVDFQAVAELLHRCHGDGIVPATHNVVQGGLGQAAQGGKAGDGQVVFLAKLVDPPLECLL